MLPVLLRVPDEQRHTPCAAPGRTEGLPEVEVSVSLGPWLRGNLPDLAISKVHQQR